MLLRSVRDLGVAFCVHPSACMRGLLMLVLLVACGSEPSNMLDSGTNADSGVQDTGSNMSTSFDDCDLGIASSNGIVMYGQAQDYLVEFGRGDTRVNLARHYVDVGVGESKLFSNVGFAMKHDGVELCVKDTSALAYENSHHNWIDAAEATAGGIRYRLEMTLEFDPVYGWFYSLYGFNGQTMILGPVGLDLLSGPLFP